MIPEDRMHYVLDNMMLVHHFAKQIYTTKNDYEDVVQEGMVGLCLAAIRFDESKGFVFTTYAAQYILGYMRRYKREYTMIKEPRDFKDIRYKVTNYKIKNPEASDDEVCEALKISKKRYIDCIINTECESLDRIIKNDGDTHVSVGDFIPDTTAFDKFFEDLDVNLLIEAKDKVLSTISNERHKAIYNDYFNSHIDADGIIQQELADKDHITQTVVSRIIKKINKMVLSEYKSLF